MHKTQETMENKPRTNTIDSLAPSLQEAITSLDPLVQPIDNEDDTPVYTHRRSSIFYLPAASTIDQPEKENDEKQSNRIRKCFDYMRRFSGILYSLIASILFTFSNFVLKQLDVIILDVLLIRFFVQVLISFGFIIYKGYRPLPACNGLLVFIRSIFAAAGSILFYYCLTILPLPDLTTIRYTQVVWTAVIASIVFRERISIPTIVACILTMGGVACVAQPTFLLSRSKTKNESSQEILSIHVNNNKHLYGMSLALLCAFLLSMSIILNKKLFQNHVRQSIIMLYFFLTTFIMIIIVRIQYMVFFKSKDENFNFLKAWFKKDFLLASFLSISQLVPMIFSQKSIKREHPSVVIVVQSSDIVFALILQNIFSLIKTNLLGLIGSILVLFSIFIVGGHKLWLDRKNGNYMPASIQDSVLKVDNKNSI